MNIREVKMNKSQWSHAKKKQYNSEVSRLAQRDRSEEYKHRILDRVVNPNLAFRDLTEETYFAALADNFPLHRVLRKILNRYIESETGKELRATSKYLYVTRNIFPGYYSDKERIIALLNRYRSKVNLFEVIEWSEFQTDPETFHYIHFLVGLIAFDNYLEFYEEGRSTKPHCLEVAIHHLQKAKSGFRHSSAVLATNGVLAFAHYMNQDFSASLKEGQHDTDILHLVNKVVA
jgi:hypothetical protein